MKTIFFIVANLVCIHVCLSFMTLSDMKNLIQCYHGLGDKRTSDEKVNGQELPLPNSLETFISIVERLESKYPTIQATEMIRKLFISFRVDEIPSDLRFENPIWTDDNLIERALFNIENINYAWKDEDFTEDEQCAMHFMLSHSVNDTLQGKDNEEAIDGVSKHPREYGVVGLHGTKKHAFSLGKVLLGIYSGLLGSNQVDAVELKRKTKPSQPPSERLSGMKINRLTAVTIADLIVVYIREKNFKRDDIVFMPNGEWNDVSCPTEYLLEDNNKRILTNSVIRGAIDGFLIGKKIEESPTYYKKLRLSEILRMYYGPTGLYDEKMSTSKVEIRSDFQWCKRTDNLRNVQNFDEEVLNYLVFYNNLPKDFSTENFASEISAVISKIQGSEEIFNQVTAETAECSRMDSFLEKCKTPVDIFPILDMNANEIQKNFQIELLGILSNDFEIRPFGNTIGAYTNLNSNTQNRALLHVIANNTGMAGCPACNVKYYKKSGSKQGEVEVLTNLNNTLTEYVEHQATSDENMGMVKSGLSSKVVLLFNFGNPVNDYRLRDAIWEVVKNFREVTILAIGPKKENLQVFTQNDDTDIFSDTGSVGALAIKLKQRICRAPAEFPFKECYRSNRGTESDNRQSGFIPVGKRQYWAMYPKYFLKSYDIKLKFKALDGAQIKVCFSRSYYRIIEESTEHKDCREPGEEVDINYIKNPCYKYNEHNCDPFYFSIEAVKAGSGICDSFYCRTPKDVVFEFSHEGVSCNMANLFYSSTLLLLVCVLLTFLKK